MAAECEDLDALSAATGARLVWGHSSGGFVALRASLTLPSVDKAVVYEPPLSIHGSISTSWIPRFDREVAQGKGALAWSPLSGRTSWCRPTCRGGFSCRS